jgi:hypothetical protein
MGLGALMAILVKEKLGSRTALSMNILQFECEA